MAKEKRPIVIRKVKKHGHGGHHGGSWKVAYADFMTAMMAFFLVMWILGMDQNVRNAVEGYFSNPIGYRKGYSNGISPISAGTSPGRVNTRPLQLVTRAQQTERFREAGERIRTQLQGNAELKGLAAQVEIVITDQGLRIELVEDGSGELFFAFGSAQVKPSAAQALRIIAQELQTVPNAIVLEGHTDSAPYINGSYSNWELSADRANAARRVLQMAGVAGERIVEVRGHADRDLKVASAPLDPRNRRISVLLPFTTADASPAEASPSSAPELPGPGSPKPDLSKPGPRPPALPAASVMR